MDQPALHRRGVTRSRFGDNTRINLGDIHNHLPHRPARSAVRLIPYPRNEDMVRRPDLADKLDALLPRTSTFCSAALWGLGGSGKTQIALDYAYRRSDNRGSSIFWVHADSETTFAHDYKTIARKLDLDQQLNDEELFAVVRDRIEAEPQWVLVLDNADDLALFGIGRSQMKDLYEYIPRAPRGTVLWTSRDERITGTLVGPQRGIHVAQMRSDEAEKLLAISRNEETNGEEGETIALLAELQWLPLAISQAGAYMRRTSTPVKDYLSLLVRGKDRWKMLKASEFDRHRRPNVPNSILETWSISIDRIRQESEMAYRILHVIVYLDYQNLPYEILAAASKCNDENSSEQPEELAIIQAITRLKEFSFVSVRRMEDGSRIYEMHKLVQEAMRYGLSVRRPVQTGEESIASREGLGEENEVYYSRIAVRVAADLFPVSKRETWMVCEKYMTHAVRVGDWAELSGERFETAALLDRVSDFLYDRGRWREKEPVDKRALGLRREVLGEKHADTIRSMASLAATYHAQGRYDEAEPIFIKVLELRQEVLRENHLDTISSMASLALMYHAQGRYNVAEPIFIKVLELRQEVLREKHPDTMSSMADLAATYHAQGRYDEAEPIFIKVLELRQEVLRENHPDTISSMADLALMYHAQGRYDEAERLKDQALNLRREVLGEKHPDTISSMAYLAATYHAQGRYDEAEGIYQEVLDLRREVLGEKHPDTISSMVDLADTYYLQRRYNEAEGIYQEALDLRREVLGEKHPDTMQSMVGLAATYYSQGRYNEAEPIFIKVLDLRRQVLGESHPHTMQSMTYLASTQKSLQHMRSLERPVQFLAATQVRNPEGGKSRRKALGEFVHAKVRKLGRWESHESKGSDRT